MSNYTYPNASQLATRTLVSDTQSVILLPAQGSHDHHDHDHHTSSERHHDASSKPILTTPTTDNYERAAALAAAQRAEESSLAAAVADAGGVEELEGSAAGRPGMQKRQSYDLRDKRGMHHRQGLLKGEGGAGYSFEPELIYGVPKLQLSAMKDCIFVPNLSKSYLAAVVPQLAICLELKESSNE
ncbi:hypothetical protein Tdes44962_MAKER00980 [Teratosphaeria destructans]|uniref:Uncharacterized protein n=1 Tax=Teratosphaeria destructans TaxID=418781 RepID=A0A9W7VYW2_9PEZI|nr:hypothetical protein Tdes44962_MAKER00980 [Teratosphaeria destructans]